MMMMIHPSVSHDLRIANVEPYQVNHTMMMMMIMLRLVVLAIAMVVVAMVMVMVVMMAMIMAMVMLVVMRIVMAMADESGDDDDASKCVIARWVVTIALQYVCRIQLCHTLRV